MSVFDHANRAIPEAHPCLHFLRVLDPNSDASYHIEAYTDVPKGTEKPKPDPLGQQLAGLTLEDITDLIPELDRLNNQGAGIFTTVNRCVGRRSKDNVTKLRAVHADVDAATDHQRRTLLESIPPSIIVTSSEPTKLHLYWLLNEAATYEKDAVSRLNRVLAYDYGADKAATDITRILRLPGFKHMKYRHRGKTPVVTASYNNCAYSLAKVQAAFPPLQSLRVQHDGRQVVSQDLSKVEAEVIAEIKARCPQLWSGAWEQA